MKKVMRNKKLATAIKILIMIKKVFFIVTILLLTTNIRAAYFEKLPYIIKQPNGKTINCFVSGDEFFNWIHDEQGLYNNSSSQWILLLCSI